MIKTLFWIDKFFRGGKTIQEAFEQFFKFHKREPSGLETIKIKQAFQEANKPSNVIEFPKTAITDWTKARPQPGSTTEGVESLFKEKEKSWKDLIDDQGNYVKDTKPKKSKWEDDMDEDFVRGEDPDFDARMDLSDKHSADLDKIDPNQGMSFYSELLGTMQKNKKERLMLEYDQFVNKIFEKAKRVDTDPKILLEAELGQKITGRETTDMLLEIFKKRPKKADGGRVGYANGGLNLSGEAQNIYNHWMNSGHTHQEALDYLASRGMYEAGSGGVENIINTQQSIIPGAGGGGGGGIGIQTPIGQNISNFQSAINTRQNRLNNPGKIAEFAYSMGMPKQASVNELLARGMRGPRDTTLMSNIPFGISGLIAKALPDMYGDMTLADQITTQAYMGYTDPNTGMSNKDPFGINVRSMFGNYAEKAAEIVDTLEAKALRNDGYLSDYDKQRLNHYRTVTRTKQDAAADLGLIQKAKEQQAEKDRIVKAASEAFYAAQGKSDPGDQSREGASGRRPGSGSAGIARDSTGTSYDRGGREGFGYGLKDGGLATMFTRRR